jgi:hypothetical protein
LVVTRNKWRDEMIKRGVARYNWQTGKWEWGDPPKDSRYFVGVFSISSRRALSQELRQAR